MPLLLIAYDPYDDSDLYDEIYNAIKKLGGAVHAQQSVWLLDTEESLECTYDVLRHLLEDGKGSLIITEFETLAGILNDKTHRWLKKRC